MPIALADSLLHLAESGLFRPLWSAAVLQEVESAVVSIHGATEAQGIQRRLVAMDAAFPDASVEGWEPLLDMLILPDQNDRHILAAALTGRADVIVTNNGVDFPEEALGGKIAVTSADEFFLDQLDLDPSVTMAALARQIAATKNPPSSVSAHLEHLGTRCSLPQFASAAKAQLWRIY